MKKQHQTYKRLSFQKVTPEKVLKCVVEQCEDGSVYVSGYEFEMLVEFAADALEQAIENLIKLGYRKVSGR